MTGTVARAGGAIGRGGAAYGFGSARPSLIVFMGDRMVKLPYGFEWRYLAGGRVAHAVDTATRGVAACGLVEDYAYWRGTGSQGEYENVARLRACKRCFHAILRLTA